MIKKIIINSLVIFYACLYPSIGRANYTTFKDVDLAMTANDLESGMGSGALMRFSNDGLNWSVAEPFATVKKNWDLTAFGGGAADGQKSVHLELQDPAGNWSDVQILGQITLDRVDPDLSVSPLGGTYNQTQTITVSSSETGNIYYTTDGTLPTSSSAQYIGSITINGPIVLSVLAQDLAGNTSAIVTEIYDVPQDTDLDGIPDSWELAYGLNPNVSDASIDSDNDGYSNMEEYLAGWDPNHIGLTLYVDDDGHPQNGDGTPQNPFQTIAQAVDQAVDGDTVLVLEGVYVQDEVLYMKERVDLVTEVGYESTIDLAGSGYIEAASFSTISGFKIINPLNSAAAISCVGTSPTIFNNIIISSQADAAGIWISDSSQAHVYNNTILDAYVGIEIDDASPTIKNNIIVDNDMGIMNYSGAPLTNDNNVWGNVGTAECPSGNYCGLPPGSSDKSQDPRFWTP